MFRGVTPVLFQIIKIHIYSTKGGNVRISFLFTLLLTGCATTKYSPDETSFDRLAKVCIYNGLSAWMNSGVFSNFAEVCEENKYTIKEEL